MFLTDAYKKLRAQLHQGSPGIRVARTAAGFTSRNPKVISTITTLAQAVLILGLAFQLLGGRQRDFGVPLSFANDGVFFLSQAKTTVENGWWWTSPRQGAPFVLHAVHYPAAGSVELAILWLVSRVVSSPILSLNLSWLLMLALSGLTATYCLRTLGFSRAACITAGTLFAFVPSAFYRHVEHFMLVVYLVPFPATAAVHLASGRISRDGTWRGALPLLAGSALVGFSYIYYAFFAFFFVALGTLIGAFTRRDPRVLRAGAVWLATIAVCVALNLAPTLYAWSREGKPTVYPSKAAAEAEVYGLKIRQLLSPGPENPLPFLQAWTRTETAALFPLENENRFSRLGLVPSIGFIALLATVLLRIVPTGHNATPMRPAAALTVSGILLATVGGFGSLFNLFVAPDVRAYNRISPFLAYYALVAIAVGLDFAGRRRRGVGMVLAVAVLGLGLWDQTRLPAYFFNPPSSEVREQFRSIEAFVARVEQALPRGAMVLQLPFVTYLGGEARARMVIHDHYKPYVVSRHLRWSYPALSNTQTHWQFGVSRLAPPQLVSLVAAQGFAAIWVDRFGYDDQGAAITSALRALNGVTTLAENDRYTVFDIRNATAMDQATALELLNRASDPPTARLTACRGEPLLNVDRIGDASRVLNAPVSVSTSEDLKVEGWVVLPAIGKTAAEVDVAIDATPFSTDYRLDRKDVSDALNNPAYRLSGFRLDIPRVNLPTGNHTLFVRAVSPDGGCFYQSPGISIVVK